MTVCAVNARMLKEIRKLLSKQNLMLNKKALTVAVFLKNVVIVKNLCAKKNIVSALMQV